jgi:hypothetical protein
MEMLTTTGCFLVRMIDPGEKLEGLSVFKIRPADSSSPNAWWSEVSN